MSLSPKNYEVKGSAGQCWQLNPNFEMKNEIFGYFLDGKNLQLLMHSYVTCNEYFKFLKNCPYDFNKIWYSHSIPPKGTPACNNDIRKSYDWNLRSSQNCHFGLFRLSQKFHTIRTKFSTPILRHIRVIYVQLHQNRAAGM